MKLLFSIISFVLLTSCMGQTKNTDSKAKDTPEVAKMLEAYNKQEHRLAFNGCEMTYNEKPIEIGMNLGELVGVLGLSYTYKFKMFYVWENIGLSISCEENKIVNGIYVYLNNPRWFENGIEENKKDFPYMINYKKDFFLINSTPIKYDTKIVDFFKFSNLSLDKLTISNQAYEIDYNCSETNLKYHLEADGLWLRKGAGHLTFKDKPNPINENSIQMIGIYDVKK